MELQDKNTPERRKVFDVQGSVTIDNAATWTSSAISTENYIQSDGVTVGALSQTTLIPSAQGSGFGQVVGTLYRLRKTSVRGSIVMGATDTAFPQVIRLSMILDLAPNLGAPAPADMFTDWGAASELLLSFPSAGLKGAGRYRVVCDKIVVLQPSAVSTTTGGFHAEPFELIWAPRGGELVHIKGGGSAPNVNLLADRNVFLVAHCSLSASVILSYCGRTEYEDE